MKIAYLVPEFPSQTHSFFWREISALRELGADLHLFSTRRPEKPSRHEFAAAATAETTYLFPPRPGTALLGLARRPGWVLAMLRYIAGLRESTLKQKLRLLGLCLVAADFLDHVRRLGIDHLHAHSCADAAHLLALTTLAGPTRYSLTLHGDLPVYGTDHTAKFARAAFVSVVTVALQRQVMAQCGLARSRLPVIRMGVDTRHFRPAPGPRADGPLRCITVARLAQCKGHHIALEALHRLRQAGGHLRYTIVGEGEQRASIEALRHRLGLDEDVRLPGTASEDEVRRHLGESDVFLLPSVGLGEAAPVSVMEAMACGLVVVSSIIGGTPEMIEHEVDGFLFEQGDSDALAAILQRLDRDPALRQRIGQAARRKAEQSFSALGFAAQFHLEMRQAAAPGA